MNIFVGSYFGAYLSTNNGINWTQVGSDHQYNLFASGLYLFAWMGGNVILKRPLSEMISSVGKPDLPTQFILNQNYPNPFNPTTTINYSVPKSGIVKIKVYDLLGREVATIVNENKPAGNYNIEFNASKLTSGIYFYRMEAGSFSQTKKLLLLK
jgi:hypothetical protein